MSRSYHVKTEKFGTLSIQADNIEDARRRAKKAYGVGPECVTRAPAMRETCAGCDSAPCVCGGES